MHPKATHYARKLVSQADTDDFRLLYRLSKDTHKLGNTEIGYIWACQAYPGIRDIRVLLYTDTWMFRRLKEL